MENEMLYILYVITEPWPPLIEGLSLASIVWRNGGLGSIIKATISCLDACYFSSHPAIWPCRRSYGIIKFADPSLAAWSGPLEAARDTGASARRTAGGEGTLIE